jgi:predicted deacylase
MEILNTSIAPGESKIINLNIAKLHTGTSLAVPVIVERAKEDGPCILLSAGIHGDEVNGVEIVRQIITHGYNKPERGSVICIPVVNVFGFLSQTREFPDGRDLNRMFPGSKTGSLASRFAYYLLNEIAPNIDYCIDFHTGGASRFNYSQIRIDIRNEETRALAKVFGSKFIIDAEERDKSFREALTDMGKHVLLFEGGKSLNLDRIVTSIGIEGTLRVMQHLNMRDFSTQLQKSTYLKEINPILIKSSTWIRAHESGMFRSLQRIGSKVKKGDVLGTISDPYGAYEVEVHASYDGYIICTNHAPIVNEGDAVIHISKETAEEF